MRYTIDKTRVSFQRPNPEGTAHAVLGQHTLCDSTFTKGWQPVDATDNGDHCRRCICLLNDATHEPLIKPRKGQQPSKEP